MYYKPWILFWVCAVLAHAYMDRTLWLRWKSWQRGQDQRDRAGGKPGAVRIFLMEVLFQRQLLSLSFFRWAAHMLIFWGFLCLAGLSMFLFILSLAQLAGIDAGLRDYFTRGSGHTLVKVWGDGFGLLLLMGLLAASFRRIIRRPPQLLNDQADLLLLVYLLWLTLSGFLLEGLRLTTVSAEVARYSFVANLFIPHRTTGPDEAGPWLTAAWTMHAFSGIGLLLYLPKSKLMHSLVGPVIIGLNAATESGRKDIYWPRVRDHRPTE